MKRFNELVAESLAYIQEVFPWDLDELCQEVPDLLMVDIREPYEYERMRIKDSINVPRGILESACEWGYEETVPELVQARNRKVVLICRSGNRSAMAAHTMQIMGYLDVTSLKTGLRGWNDFELPLFDNACQEVSIDDADEYFTSNVRPDQLEPK